MSADPVETIFETVAAVTPEIRKALIRRGAVVGESNPSGERQRAADVYADRLLAERLLALDGVGTYASEERTELLSEGSGYSVAVDPVDGSSNLKANNATGTIVGVYDDALPAPGKSLVGACYVLYGSRTTMVSATGGTVTESVVEDGERSPLCEDVTLPRDPEAPSVYGFGGRAPEWFDGFESFVRDVEGDLKLRYSGSMIADVNQVLTYGGIFGYPGLRSAPEGKLRLLYEANPIGYIFEAAGGRSSDGEGSVLDVPATDLHRRVPVHVGSPDCIDRLEDAVGPPPHRVE